MYLILDLILSLYLILYIKGHKYELAIEMRRLDFGIMEASCESA